MHYSYNIYNIPHKNLFKMRTYLSIIIIFFLSFLTVTSCQKNPATGQNEFSLMSEEEEDSIGRNEHKKIIKQFGGEYNDERLKNYIESIGNFLVSTSELSNKRFIFTILDTPIINAFALPGGYVYLTRGLIYLCQNEAQLAGVISHEIGHVTARHSARRYTKSIGTDIVLRVLGVISKNNYLNNLLGQSAQLYLLSYSRSQEYQADQLAVRYMVRAGFDPKEMASFLRSMEKHADLQKKIFKIDKKVSELLLTHPNSSKRVLEVVNNYQGKIPLNPIVGEDIFLKKIDGLLFGNKPNEGFFLGNSFIHKPLKIKFDFDKNFYFINNPKALIGTTTKKTKVIFDLDETVEKNDINYLSKWTSISKKKIKEYKSFTSNGFNITTGSFKKNKQLFSFATLKQNQNITYRFLMVSNESEIKDFKDKFQNIFNSFQILTDSEISSLEPPRIKIISVQSDSDLKNITSNKLNLQSMYSQEIFSTLNNLDNKIENLNRKIKTIYWFKSSSNLFLAAFFSRFWTAAYSLLSLFKAVKYICLSE